MAEAKKSEKKAPAKRGKLQFSKETLRDLRQKGQAAEKVKGGRKVALISIGCTP